MPARTLKSWNAPHEVGVYEPENASTVGCSRCSTRVCRTSTSPVRPSTYAEYASGAWSFSTTFASKTVRTPLPGIGSAPVRARCGSVKPATSKTVQPASVRTFVTSTTEMLSPPCVAAATHASTAESVAAAGAAASPAIEEDAYAIRPFETPIASSPSCTAGTPPKLWRKRSACASVPVSTTSLTSSSEPALSAESRKSDAFAATKARAAATASLPSPSASQPPSLRSEAGVPKSFQLAVAPSSATRACCSAVGATVSVRESKFPPALDAWSWILPAASAEAGAARAQTATARIRRRNMVPPNMRL